MPHKKRKRTGISCILTVDPEDGGLLDFMWTEDYDPPPIVIPKKEGDAKKKRRPS